MKDMPLLRGGFLMEIGGSMTDAEYMSLALEEAEKAFAEGEVPIGAVLVRGGQLLAAGRNRLEQSPDPTAHAEILCLRRGAERLGRRRLTDCTLYVTIEPCAMCAGAIMNARLGRLVYGAADAMAGGISSQYHIADGSFMNHRLSVTSGILADECKALVDRFFRSRR